VGKSLFIFDLGSIFDKLMELFCMNRFGRNRIEGLYFALIFRDERTRMLDGGWLRFKCID